MDKQNALELLKLLSALELWSFGSKTPMQDYFLERLCDAISQLTDEVLK